MSRSRNVVLDETTRGSRWYKLDRMLRALREQAEQEEYPYNVDDLFGALQDIHDGRFFRKWAHPNHFLISVDYDALYEEFRMMRGSGNACWASPVDGIEMVSLSLVTDIWALHQIAGFKERGTLSDFDKSLERAGLGHASIAHAMALSKLRTSFGDRMVFAAGSRKEFDSGDLSGWEIPGIRQGSSSIKTSRVYTDDALSLLDGPALLVVHKHNPYRP